MRAKIGPVAQLAFFADDPAHPIQLLRHALVAEHDFVEHVANLALNSRHIRRHADSEVPIARGDERGQKAAKVQRPAWFGGVTIAVGWLSRLAIAGIRHLDINLS